MKIISLILLSLFLYSKVAAQYLEIEYRVVAKTPEGQEFISFYVLKDDGKSSVYAKLDTSLHRPDKAIPLPNSKRLPIYFNKAEDKLLCYTPVFSKDFYVREEKASGMIDWKMIDSVSTKLLGYDCKLATAEFRGRHYDVFYTEALPFFTGPWKLHGLPGVVLKATIDGMFNFEATKVRVSDQQVTLENPYKNIKGPYLGFVKQKTLFLKKMQDWQRKTQSEEKDADTEYSFKDNSIELLDSY